MRDLSACTAGAAPSGQAGGCGRAARSSSAGTGAFTHGRRAGLAALVLLCLSQRAPAEPAVLPAGFVHLSDVDPSIEQQIRYATTENFTGRRVPGYEAGECVLIATAASALARVQADLRPQGLSLRVYDCYRPARAARAFAEWVRGPAEPQASRRYHPRLSRSELLAQGYIAEVSGHSLGVAVDLTLVRLKKADAPPPAPAPHPGGCRAPADGSLDMGTEFDCFDTASHVGASGLTVEQRRWRDMLAAAMSRRGFKGYAREWWHFTWQGRSGGVRHDFPITARPGRAAP